MPTVGIGRAAALIAFLLLLAASSARADIGDYEFQIVEPGEHRVGEATIAVEIRYRPTGERVTDAVLFAHRLDMEPDGMATMTSPLKLLPAREPGLYRLGTDLTMAGRWRLSLAAKIQGETDTLVSRLVFGVAP
jgi:hypothetical protein